MTKVCKLSLTYPMFPEFPDDGFMHEEFYIFQQVECLVFGVTLLCLLAMLGLSRVNSFEDA